MNGGATLDGRTPQATPVILHGRRLLLARATVGLVAVLAIALFMRAVPLLFMELQVVCTGRGCVGLTADRARQLQVLGWSRGAYATYIVANNVVAAAVYFAVAALLVWRKSAERMALFSALTLVTFAATFTQPLYVLARAYPGWWWIVTSLGVLGSASTILVFYLFPDGQLVPRWALWLAAPWILARGIGAFFPDSLFNQLNWPFALSWLFVFGGIAPAVVAQIYRYRRVSNPLQRQQTKVVVFGVTVACAGNLGLPLGAVFLLPFLLRNALADLITLTVFSAVMLLPPVSVGVAILRYRLWDIDLLINKVLVYGTLTVTLGAFYGGSVVGLIALLPGLTGERSTVAIAVATLFLAALVQPLRRRIQIAIDRRFYRRKYDATQALTSFSIRLRDEVDLDAVTTGLFAVVHNTVQPAHIALWLREVELAPGDPLITQFHSVSEAVDLDKITLHAPVLQTWKTAGIQLVVPLVSQGELIGLLGLGPRRSEQDYSTDDRALLTALAAQVAPALRIARLVREQRAQAQERARIEQELRVARLIQQTLLPKVVPALPGWEMARHYQPAREVGGDFYDFLTLPDGRLGFTIGDVTDKGVPAALVMATAHSVLRGAIAQMASPGRVLEWANDVLSSDMPPNMFITCLCAILEPQTGQLQYANAGHVPPYVRHADAVSELCAMGMPLGLMPGAQYEEKSTTLLPGEQVLFYSDGLVEAHDTQRDMFSFPRLHRLMAEHPPGDGAAMICSLLAELERFTGHGWEQEDDITLVTLHRCAPASLSTSADVAGAGLGRASS